MADAGQLMALTRAIEELRARVSDARATYGELPAFRRVVNDVERLCIDAGELDFASPVSSPSMATSLTKIPIDDTPPDPAMWGDADDEGVGGFHGPHSPYYGAPHSRSGSHGTHR